MYRDDVDALRGEVLGRGLARIAGNTPDFVLLRERRIGLDGSNDGASLVARGAKDGNELRHNAVIWSRDGVGNDENWMFKSMRSCN